MEQVAAETTSAHDESGAGAGRPWREARVDKDTHHHEVRLRNGRRPLPPDVTPFHVINIPQVATVLDMTPRHVRRLIKNGKLKLPLIRVSDRKVGALFSDVCKLVDQCKDGHNR